MLTFQVSAIILDARIMVTLVETLGDILAVGEIIIPRSTSGVRATACARDGYLQHAGADLRPSNSERRPECRPGGDRIASRHAAVGGLFQIPGSPSRCAW